MPILIASNSSSCVTCLNKSSSAFIRYSCNFAMLFAASGAPAPDAHNPYASEQLEIDVDGERPDLLHQHVERLGHARVDLVVALDDVLVVLGAAGDVVGLGRQHLLQRVRRPVGLERPDFHLAEALPAELRLAA